MKYNILWKAIPFFSSNPVDTCICCCRWTSNTSTCCCIYFSADSGSGIVVRKHVVHYWPAYGVAYRNPGNKIFLVFQEIKSFFFLSQLLVMHYIRGKNIWNKVKKHSKIGKEWKTLVFPFAYFLTAIVKV